jgi:hypothetical protein
MNPSQRFLDWSSFCPLHEHQDSVDICRFTDVGYSEMKIDISFYAPCNIAPSNLTTEKDQMALFNGRRDDSLLDDLRSPVIESRNLTVRLSFALPIQCSQVDYSREIVGSA